MKFLPIFVLTLFGISKGAIQFRNSSMEPFVGTSSQEPTNSNTLSIQALVNFDGNFGPGPICTKALELGLERLKKSGILNGIDLKIELRNTKCNESIAIKETAIDLVKEHSGQNRLPIMILDECPSFGNLIGAKLLKVHNFIGLTTNFKTTNLDLAKEMTTFGFVPEMTYTPAAWLEFMVKMKWKKYALFSDNHKYFNAIESPMHDMFGERGSELAIMTKVDVGQPHLEVQIEMAVRAIKNTRATIVIVHSDHIIALTCWLHRLGMVRNHAFLGSGWVMYDPDTVKMPEEVSQWCTRSMLKEALKAWIWIDIGWMNDIFGDEYQDSTGLTRSQFTELMRQKVVDADKQRPWGTWAPRCYDLGLYTSSLVAKIQKRLEIFNSSLFNWVIDGDNFKANSSFIKEMIMETVFNHQIEGQQFSISIDRDTRRNSNGWPSILLKQILPNKDNERFSHVNVAFFKYNERKFIDIAKEGVQWATDDGKPPVDRIEKIELTIEPTSIQSYIAFSVISTCLIVISIVFFVELKIRKINRYQNYHFNSTLLIAIAILLAHGFAIPFQTNRPIVTICNISFFLFVIGLTLCLSSIIAIIKVRDGESQSKCSKTFGLFWISLVQLILVGTFIGIGGISTRKFKESMQISNDGKKEFIFFKEVCIFDLSKSNSIFGVLIAIGAVLVLQLLLMAFRAYSTKQKN